MSLPYVGDLFRVLPPGIDAVGVYWLRIYYVSGAGTTGVGRRDKAPDFMELNVPGAVSESRTTVRSWGWHHVSQY